MALAVRTGIPPSVWAAEGEAAIITAFDLLEQAAKQQGERNTPGPGGPQMSG